MLTNRKRSSSADKEDERESLIPTSDSSNDASSSMHDDVSKLKSRSTRHSRERTGSYELKQINQQKNRRDQNNDSNYVLYDIRSGDTLTSLALRYRCSVARIKELNRIGSDQEFYALKQIKLPNGKLGLLGELLNQEQQSNDDDRANVIYSRTTPGTALLFRPDGTRGDSFYMNRHHKSNPVVSDLLTSSSEDSSKQNTPSDRQNRQTADVQIPLPCSLAGQEMPEQINDVLIPDIGQTRVEAIFNTLDQHIEQVKASTESFEQRTSELVNDIDLASGPDLDRYTTRVVNRQRRNIYGCDDGDFGLSYMNLLIFIFLVCLIVPLIVLYIVEESSQSNL